MLVKLVDRIPLQPPLRRIGQGEPRLFPIACFLKPLRSLRIHEEVMPITEEGILCSRLPQNGDLAISFS